MYNLLFQLLCLDQDVAIVTQLAFKMMLINSLMILVLVSIATFTPTEAEYERNATDTEIFSGGKLSGTKNDTFSKPSSIYNSLIKISPSILVHYIYFPTA